MQQTKEEEGTGADGSHNTHSNLTNDTIQTQTLLAKSLVSLLWNGPQPHQPKAPHVATA